MRSLRILIVDDSPEDRSDCRRLLTNQSRLELEFIESENGEAGLAACSTRRPDCILLNYRLPDLTVAEFLTRLRAADESGAPVVVLTRQGSEAIAVEAVKAGAQDYVLKDAISTEILTRSVEYAIEKMTLITRLKQAERALRESHDQLEQRVQQTTAELTRASRMKDEFLATLSHELRTPLNAILGWITLVRDGRLAPERLESALESIERNARAQAKLIEDLLDVSRIISGKFVLEPGEVDLKRIVDAACEVVRPAAEAKRIRLLSHAEPGDTPAVGDGARLQQAVWNLLSNAVKFTAENGQVEVRLKTSRGHAQISVSDNGLGIEPEFLPYVFDRFRQADDSITRSQGGLGIGLAIVRHIVELHRGSVWAESGGPNTGSTFTIDIPVVNSPSFGRSRELQP